MKRKLDENNVPSVEVDPDKVSFESFDLDPRLLQAIQKQQYTKPTLIQAFAIPLALQGKDILGQAKTGSGKTAAYILPLLQSILQRHGIPELTTLILLPSRELAEQVHRTIISFSLHCQKEIKSVNLTQKQADAVTHASLQESPSIIISTPSRVLQFINGGHLNFDSLRTLVIDEADLILSYGYEKDIKTLSDLFPRGIQTILMSATLTDEVDALKKLFCRSPAILKLEEEGKENNLSQYVVKCAEDEKFLLIFVIFKLKLIRGKIIVFVADIDRCYRLKLYLEQFGIRSCILNSELPVNSRLHVVQEFNKDVYDIIIASDEQEIIGGVETRKKVNSQDFGVSRGIDFQNVACVLNFDLPQSPTSYTHRIGRTARAGRSGMALSFVVPHELFGKHKSTTISSSRNDEKVLEKIVDQQSKKGRDVKPYTFDMNQVDGFRYRMNDALRAVTRIAVRDARAKEIRQELMKSEKLKKHFEENPDDLRHLRHDQDSRTVRIQSHLQHVPDYLMPVKGRKGVSSEELGFVPMQRIENKAKKRRKIGGHRPTGRKRLDPLKSFKSRGIDK